jgi:molecular chaperone HscB
MRVDATTLLYNGFQDAGLEYLCCMTYFELFDLPVSLLINRSELAQRYFALQKKYHPDYYTQASAEEQAAVLEQSALVNKAFKTFQQPDETIKYVLQLKGVLQEEEKYELPPDFLMAMMELNESLMEADAESVKRLEQEIGMIEADLYAAVQPVLERHLDEKTPVSDLLAVKTYYFKKKYLERIKERLRNIATQ